MTGPTVSRYVTLSDGARIAISLWHPAPLVRSLPVVVQFTEYWRYPADSPIAEAIDEVAASFGRRGYAFATIDIRGSGASTGVRDGIFTPRVRQDIAELVGWTAAQPFSDGDVFAYGISNAGTFAELAALSGEPAVRGAAMLYSDFDLFGDTFLPGGVETTALTAIWQPVMSVRDGILAADDLSVPESLREKAALFAAGVLPVDDDVDRRTLAAAIEEHRGNIDLRVAGAGLAFRDDPFGVAHDGLDQASTFTHYAAGGDSTVPQLVIVSWRDAATARGALNRYAASTGPMRVEITPWGHGGHEPGDPYGGAAGEVIPVDDRIGEIAAFFDECRAGTATDRRVRYYELGGNRWREARTWPEASRRLRFAATPTGGLVETSDGEHPRSEAVALVADDAETGDLTRWRTQVTGCVVDYRGFSARNRTAFTTPALPGETVLLGSPRVRATVRPLTDDAVVFAYLEAVDAEGVGHLLTDGQLRIRSRRARSTGDGLDVLGALQSLRAADVEPVVPGDAVELTIALLPVAARLAAGSRLRLSFAASDTASFTRVPESGPIGYRLVVSETALEVEVE